ncbi:RNA 2'-phosphotransferase [Candidatus Omnitrophota bacterium]
MTGDEFKVRLSKFLSYVLRHDPGKYDLRLDKHGYAELKDVLALLRERFRQFTNETLFRVVDEDEKGRFEMKDDKIRATYGHSIAVENPRESVAPPELLYHGTSPYNAEVIVSEGLKPMGRKYVHMSQNEEDARGVGSRHTADPVIVFIEAAKAYAQGTTFFREGRIFLAEFIPAAFLRKE